MHRQIDVLLFEGEKQDRPGGNREDYRAFRRRRDRRLNPRLEQGGKVAKVEAPRRLPRGDFRKPQGLPPFGAFARAGQKHHVFQGVSHLGDSGDGRPDFLHRAQLRPAAGVSRRFGSPAGRRVQNLHSRSRQNAVFCEFNVGCRARLLPLQVFQVGQARGNGMLRGVEKIPAFVLVGKFVQVVLFAAV